MARDDSASAGVKQWPVKRMCHLADQPVDRIAWQPGVGVERKDVADATGYGLCQSDDVEKTGVGSAAQQPVQLMQLAALAFPTDPACFAGVPNPLAM